MMKRLSLLLITFIFFPAVLSAQYKVKAVHQEPIDLKVTIHAYDERIPAAVMNLRFEFDQEAETLLVRFSKGSTSCEYDKIWLPQHDIIVKEMGNYMKNRDVKLKKAQTFVDQENFLNLSDRTLWASIQCQNMSFTGIYDLKSPKKVKKQLDHQMVPLDGQMELSLSFKINEKSPKVVLTLRNPIPMNRKGSKGIAAFVANDVTINIELDRCKNVEQSIQTVHEYEAMFQVAEKKLLELKKSPTAQKAYKDFILSLYHEIDTARFVNMCCDEVQASFNSWMECMGRIREIGKKQAPCKDCDQPKPCDVSKINSEIKSTTTKLNNLVNDWSLASDAASKAEKKATFDSTIQNFDAKLNELPSDCKGKLDVRLLKNYEFVKKLIK